QCPKITSTAMASLRTAPHVVISRKRLAVAVTLSSSRKRVVSRWETWTSVSYLPGRRTSPPHQAVGLRYRFLVTTRRLPALVVRDSVSKQKGDMASSRRRRIVVQQ